MLRASPPICLFCRTSASFSPQWNQVRTYAHAQRRRPSRMVLSSRVSQSGTARAQRRRDNDPSSTPTRDEATTSRKQRRAQYFKEVIRARENASGQVANAARGMRQDLGTSHPSWSSAGRRKKSGDGGLKTSPADRPKPGPFGALNQRSARLPTARSQAWASRKSNEAKANKSVGKNKEKAPSSTFHSLKMQQALATVSYSARNQVKSKISEIETFDDFPLLPSLQEAVVKDALKGLEVISPTPIQRLAIPALLGVDESRRRRQTAKEGGMRQFLLAAETGSGKTMAYLLPSIDSLKRAEAEEKRLHEALAVRKQAEDHNDSQTSIFEISPPEDFDDSSIGKPRVVVLVPTAELVEQVGILAKTLSHIVKFRTSFVSSNYSKTVIKNRMFCNMDVLVSTPHLLASISDSEPKILSKVSHLIIDEADSLLDRSFLPTTSKIIDKASPSLQQLIFCSATIPRRLDNYLRERFPDLKRLTTPNLHAIPRRVQLGVVDVEKDPYKGNKDLACADVIWKIGSSAAEYTAENGAEKVPVKRLIVFVNEREKSVELAEYLASKGIDAVALHRDLDTRTQTDLLAQFCSSASPTESRPIQAKTRKGKNMVRTLPNTKVLVCTDIASRGIDTTAVRHVVLYDVPHTSIDFIHRLGRTGRMGRRGRGVVLVGKDDRRDVVREIRESMFRGAALI
ncbi:uncharacterized protein PV09_06635 [Verruconis gallopava]|uniref:RNA helicase n=1 Tax=Verruconis gallopava TaxID=253628 RepID=A0A0D2A6E9_9PEZI|nr:uncharacterized protein PV09_06635 [Verruconis gallopava]KIW02150.1 hypothetical protein PV09_06635 [Verruconis gallopava]